MSKFKLELDFRTNLPITNQIVAQLADLIINGQVKPGERLPTMRRLATDLQVNFNTVARAYRMLDDMSLTSVQHGRGTYVLPTGSPGRSHIGTDVLNRLAQRYLENAVLLGFDRAAAEQALAQARLENIGNQEIVEDLS